MSQLTQIERGGLATLLGTRAARLCAVVSLVGTLSGVATPVALAQGHPGQDRPRVEDRREPERRDFRDGRDRRPDFREPPVIVPAPVVPAAPQVVPPVPQAVPIQSPALLAAVLPPLEAVLPAANFAQNPPQLVPLPNGTYALVSPALFYGTDQAGTCEALASQLAQITPGWGTGVLNGPDGYGVYLTYQSYS